MSQSLQILRALALALGAMLSFHTFAQATLAVSATVSQTCVITSGTLTFGSYTGVELPGTGSITATCTNGTSPKIMMGQGLNAAGGSTDDAPLRRMQLAATGQYLPYYLYSAGANTTIWGNTAATAKVLSATGLLQSVTVYGTIPAGNYPSAGAYADTIIITFTF
jgi:spore coat protein U domain-containing protein, fimbrial subunit CupE1/2/3/6